MRVKNPNPNLNPNPRPNPKPKPNPHPKPKPKPNLNLGVITEGGRFYRLIAAGWTPPTRGSATFTTVTDLQTEVEIKVVALDASGSTSLGSFTLAPNL